MTSVNWNKKVMFRTKCINTEDALFLREKWYDVVESTPTQYLIKFYSGATKWYSRLRFRGKFINYSTY